MAVAALVCQECSCYGWTHILAIVLVIVVCDLCSRLLCKVFNYCMTCVFVSRHVPAFMLLIIRMRFYVYVAIIKCLSFYILILLCGYVHMTMSSCFYDYVYVHMNYCLLAISLDQKGDS